MRIFGFGDKQECVDTREDAIGIRLLAFVLEVDGIAHTFDEDIGMFASCDIDGQVVVDDNSHARFIVIDTLDGFLSLSGGVEAVFGAIIANGYHDCVEERECAFNDIVVTTSKWVETTREKGYHKAFI